MKLRDSIIRPGLFGRLLLIFFVTTVAIINIVLFSHRMMTDSNMKELIKTHLSQYVQYIIEDIGTPPSVSEADSIAQRLPLDIYISGQGFEWKSTDLFPPMKSLRFVDGPIPHAQVARDHHHNYVREERDGYQFVFVSPKLDGSDPRGYWLIVAVAGSIVILLVAYSSVQWLFQPIQKIKQGAERIGNGELDYRIPVRRKGEFATLTRSINLMAEELGKMLEAKRQLLLAISHELRSPLTRSKVALEFIEDEKVKNKLADDLHEMERLINDLLESEKLNTSHRQLNLVPVQFKELIEHTAADFFKEEKERLEYFLSDDDRVTDMDVPRMKVLVRNLTENALRHSGNAPIQLHLKCADNGYEFKVVDQGDGIEEEHIPHLLEPFYRVDPSRQRKTGGYGLGLYLCRLIAEAHGGRIDIFSKLEEGTEVLIQIPYEQASVEYDEGCSWT